MLTRDNDSSFSETMDKNTIFFLTNMDVIDLNCRESGPIMGMHSLVFLLPILIFWIPLAIRMLNAHPRAKRNLTRIDHDSHNYLLVLVSPKFHNPSFHNSIAFLVLGTYTLARLECGKYAALKFSLKLRLTYHNPYI